jgi:uncharacterized protein with HEPN domain
MSSGEAEDQRHPRLHAVVDARRLCQDRKTVDAVLRNLEVIGEAVKQLPAEMRSAHPDVEWQKIAGLRDVLIHAYFGIDLDIVWDVVSNKLPGLERRIREIMQG